MRTIFPYKEKGSNIFVKIKRPVATIYFWSKLIDGWLGYEMIVDSGADFTILPKQRSLDLGIDLRNDCFPKETSGVGGSALVFFCKKRIRVKIGENQVNIPFGFLNSNTIPPLLGREECLNLFKLTFVDFQTEISTK